MDMLTRFLAGAQTQHTDTLGIVIGLIASFVLSQAIAWVYVRTYHGFSYSRNFVHAMILGSLVTTVMIAGIGNSLARGLGVLGVMAIIRFRTQIRDPRDIIFLFATLAMGIAAGAGAVIVAALGTACFCVVALYLHWSPFASLRTHEGLVRFAVEVDGHDGEAIAAILDRCCSRYELASQREAHQGQAIEYALQVRLRDAGEHQYLAGQLNALDGVEDASLIMHRATVEI